MKIQVDDIPETGLSLDLSATEQEMEKAAGGELDFTIAAPVKAHLDVTKSGPDVSVTGEIKTLIRLACSRCLKEIETPVDISFYDFFVRARPEQKEQELKPEDLEVEFLEGTELDTSAIILAQLSLEVPIKPLCTPECKGLCPTCGADLNEGPCGCGKAEKIDPRLAALKDFKGG